MQSDKEYFFFSSENNSEYESKGRLLGQCGASNAVAESLFKTIKYESLNRQKFDTTEQLYKQLFEYIEEWYNVKRIHSSLGYMTPLEKEIQLKFNLKKAA